MRAPKTLFDAIEWCSLNLAIISFLPTGTRSKNAVAVTFQNQDSTKETVGGYTVLHAVQKACIKIECEKQLRN